MAWVIKIQSSVCVCFNENLVSGCRPLTMSTFSWLAMTTMKVLPFITWITWQLWLKLLLQHTDMVRSSPSASSTAITSQVSGACGEENSPVTDE